MKSSRHVLAVAPNVAAMVNLFLNPLRKLNGLKKEDQFIDLELDCKLLTTVSELHETGSNNPPGSNFLNLFLCYLLGFHSLVSRKIGKDVSIK